MRFFLKVIFVLLFVFAGYKAHRHLILGIPVDPEKTLTEWSQRINAETPKKISDTVALTGVRFDWNDPKGIANFYDNELTSWVETYEVTGPREPSTLDQARVEIIDGICRNEMHQKIMALTNIELLLRTPREVVAVDPATAFRLGGPRILYPIEKRVTVSKASCVGR